MGTKIRFGLMLAVLWPLALAADVTVTNPYPRTLVGDEIQLHFFTHPRLEIQEGGHSYKINVYRGGRVTLLCPACSNRNGDGEMRFRPIENQVCVDWERRSYPASGCYHVVQTGESSFALQARDGRNIATYRVETIKSPPTPGISSSEAAQSTSASLQLVNSIGVDFSPHQPSVEQLRTAAGRALIARGWRVEPNSEQRLMLGRLEKRGITYRVGIRIQESRVEIGYVPNYEKRNQDWLRNLELEMRSEIELARVLN